MVGLSVEEFNALASCKLAVLDQARLDDLVAKNAESLLCVNETAELDDLLAKAETRARYTLKCLEEATTAV